VDPRLGWLEKADSAIHHGRTGFTVVSAPDRSFPGGVVFSVATAIACDVGKLGTLALSLSGEEFNRRGSDLSEWAGLCLSNGICSWQVSKCDGIYPTRVVRRNHLSVGRFLEQYGGNKTLNGR